VCDIGRNCDKLHVLVHHWAKTLYNVPMDTQTVIAILLTVTALASYINYRYIKLPSAIGLTLITLIASLLFIGLDKIGFQTRDFTQELLETIDFNTTVMGGMIGFLLFAGGLHINAIELFRHKWSIATLSTLGVIISTIIVGFTMWSISLLFDVSIDLYHCLLFGALIAPTDPIAVLSIFKKISAPNVLTMNISGESLFNDGISIVLFVTLLELGTNVDSVSHSKVYVMFMQQLGGGVIMGLILGFITNFLLRKVNNFEVSVLVTLSIVTGGYLVATKFGTSGPIAMVVAGLLIGLKIKEGGLSTGTARHLLIFWELIDEVLNALLFVLIGLVVFQLTFSTGAGLVALIAIPVVLLARYVSVAFPIAGLSLFMKFSPNTINIMTWGGLRGGISIALALSLPSTAATNELILITYAVVVFSIIVQGLTIGPLIRKTVQQEHEHD